MKKQLSRQIAIAIMKISLVPALLLMLVFCSYASDTRGQKLLDKKVTLQLADDEMRNVFTALEKQTDVKFVYSPELIVATRKISVDDRDKQLDDGPTNLLGTLNTT